MTEQAEVINKADSSEGSDLTESKFACDANDVPTKIETRGRKKKYQNDTDRLNARKEQQKKYRDRQKEKVKELLLLVDGLDADDIAELKNKAQELRNKNVSE